MSLKTILITGLLSAAFNAAVASETPPATAVASAHPLATAAGHEILAAGGNAFDAAVAVSAALAVVEPSGSGLGGGGFWLLHRQKDGFQIMIDGREKAPAAAHRDMYLDEQGNVVPKLSMDGPLAAGIPGVPAALDHLARQYGRLPLKRSLAPAIRLAKEGFTIDEGFAMMVQFRLEAIRQSPAAAKVLLKNNDVPPVGHRILQPDLAQTLQAMADKGSAGFYQGAVGQKLVEGSRAAGGIWTLNDLAEYQVVERKPIQAEINGLRISTAAPPSSGGIALVTMLNILAGYDLTKLDNQQRTHLVVEAMRRAYRDRALYLGDSDFFPVPVERLTNANYAAGLRASINPAKATPSSQLSGEAQTGGGNDTTHFSILDSEGNRVAATLSVNYPFGSCFIPPGTGVLLNDEMDDFSAKPGVPNAYGLVGGEANAIAAGKRPLSSMSPTFLENDRGIAVVGTPGGSRIITMVLLAALAYHTGASAQEMVSLPRYHHQYLPDIIQHEAQTFSLDDKLDLQQLGHQLEEVRSDFYGNMQVVVWDKKHNDVQAASDPRQRGEAEVKKPKNANNPAK